MAVTSLSGIIKLRVTADTEQDIRDFADMVRTLPDVTASDSVRVIPNRGEGFRGYMTFLVEKSSVDLLTWLSSGENDTP